MISQYEVNSLLRKEIPQLAWDVYPSMVSLEVYASMNYFSNYTKQAIQEHDFDRAKKCFGLAEKLYRLGDRTVRSLIENIFVFGFTAFLSGDKKDRLMVKSMIPPALYSLYIRQVMQTGC